MPPPLKACMVKASLRAEEFVRTLCHRYLIVRSAWVYGIGRDFVSTVLNAAADPTCPWLAVSHGSLCLPYLDGLDPDRRGGAVDRP